MRTQKLARSAIVGIFLLISTFVTCKKNYEEPVIPISSLELSSTSASIVKGNTRPLTVTISPSNASNQKITWSSSNVAIATVVANKESTTATVTGVGTGKAVIKATTADGKKTAMCSITISEPIVLVSDISLSLSTTKLTEGNTQELIATIAPENATNKTIAWASTDETIATVNSAGLITGVKAGKATITATTQDGNKKATCEVTVEARIYSVESIMLNHTTATIIEGSTQELIATITPENATNKTIAWASTDETIATVNSAGLITGVKAGRATITATTQDGNKKATCEVTVEARIYSVESITLNHTTATIIEGSTQELIATIIPENATNKTIAWASTDETIATVNSAGLITGVKAGKTTITATTQDGNKKATCEVTVEARIYPVESIAVSPTSLSLAHNATEKLTVTFTPENATNKLITWKSSDEAIATVSNTGEVTVTSSTGGQTIITATTEDGNKTATCTVTAITSAVVSFANENMNLTWNGSTKEITNVATATCKNEIAYTVDDMQYTSSDNTHAPVDASGKVTVNKAGSYTITATVSAKGSCLASSKTYILNIAKATPVLSFASTGKTITLGSNDLSAPTLSGIPTDYAGALVYSFAAYTNNGGGNDGAAISANGTMTINKAGNGTVKVVLPADDNYNESEATFSLTVNKATPTMEWNTIPPTTMKKDETYTTIAYVAGINGVIAPVVVGSSEITYSTSNTNVATVSTLGVVTWLSTNVTAMTTITAMYPGDDNYTSVSKSYDISSFRPLVTGYDWQPNEVAVFIAAGQSNSASRSGLATSDQTNTSQPNVWIARASDNYNFTNTSVTWSNFSTNIAGNTMGCGGNWCETGSTQMANSPNYIGKWWQEARNNDAQIPDLYIVHVALGGQGIDCSLGWSYWCPTATTTTDTKKLFPFTVSILQRVVNTLKASGKVPRFIGVDWNQWETDNGSATAKANYQTNMMKIINGFSAAAGADLHFWMHKPAINYGGERTTITSKMQAIIDSDPTRYNWIDPYTSGSPWTDPGNGGCGSTTAGNNTGLFNGDCVHYSMAGQKWMAQYLWSSFVNHPEYWKKGR